MKKSDTPSIVYGLSVQKMVVKYVHLEKLISSSQGGKGC